MSDRYEELAREWLDCDEGCIPETVSSLSALLRRVAEEAQQERAGVMQDDLAALLRALGESDAARPETPHAVMLGCISKVAALRTEVERLKQIAICLEGGRDQAKSELSAAREQVRRLREALEEIAKQKLGEETWDDLLAVAEGCIERARAALAETAQEEKK